MAIRPSGKWLAAILLFLGVDCAYYWFHRIAHRFNAPWAGHVVHHSSEDYNLAVALRQGTFQGAFSWVFYLPLALVGYPPSWFAAMASFDTLYQFWIHTRAIGKLGPHGMGVQHAVAPSRAPRRNPKYLDKNYAGTLIIWDRMFGTFQPEEEEPVYGLTKPLNSWNPLWANLHVWRDLCRDAWLAPRWVDKLRIWFMPQGWRPAGLPTNPIAPEVTRETVIRYDTDVPRGLNAYVFAHFVTTLLLAIGLLALAKSLSRGELVLPAALVLWAPAEYRRHSGPSTLGASFRNLTPAGVGRGAGRLVARRPMAHARTSEPGTRGGGVLALPVDLSPPVRRHAATSQPRDRALDSADRGRRAWNAFMTSFRGSR